jgi:hypothetical protein
MLTKKDIKWEIYSLNSRVILPLINSLLSYKVSKNEEIMALSDK